MYMVPLSSTSAAHQTALSLRDKLNPYFSRLACLFCLKSLRQFDSITFPSLNDSGKMSAEQRRPPAVVLIWQN
jgi:hypothetical protein